MGIEKTKMSSQSRSEENHRQITPKERNDAILRLQVFLQQVNPMGGNDNETAAQGYLEQLRSGEACTREELDKVFRWLGEPDDKSVNYH